MAQTIIGQTPVPPSEPTALPKDYRHPLVQSRYIPETANLSFVPGTPTLVEYYRGYYGTDSEQMGFQPESIETYQSYTRVKNMILKVDNGNGDFIFDPMSGGAGHTLTGYILFDLAPNIGDMFIKDIGSGRAGLYTLVIQPEYKTIQADKCYYFEASLIAVVNEAIAFNLNSKVVKELYYSKESQTAGGNAVLTQDDWTANLKLNQLRKAIIDDLLANHYYSDEETIVIPNSFNDRLYDPYLARFLSNVIPRNMIAPRHPVRVLNVQYWTDTRKQQEPITIWDMFYRNDFSHPERYKQDYYVHNRASLMNTRFYGNVFFSKMDRVITIHKAGSQRNTYLYSGALIPSPIPAVPAYPPIEGLPIEYFFGNDFLSGNGTETQNFIWKMFRDKTIDKHGLIEVLEKYWDLDDISKLYMGGIYLGAIKTALITTGDYT